MVSDPVSGLFIFQIRGICAPANAPGTQIILYLRPFREQKRPYDHISLREHPSNTLDAGASENVKQHRLCLIITVVRDGDQASERTMGTALVRHA